MLWKGLTIAVFTILLFHFTSMAESATDVTYEAPLRSHGGQPEDLAPGIYGVYLFPGHSLEQHSKFIKTDLTPYIMHVFGTV